MNNQQLQALALRIQTALLRVWWIRELLRFQMLASLRMQILLRKLLLRLELWLIRKAGNRIRKAIQKSGQPPKEKTNLQRLKAFSESSLTAWQGAVQLAHAASSPELTEGTKPHVQLSRAVAAISLHLFFRLQKSIRETLLLWFLRSRLLHRLIIPFTARLVKHSCAVAFGSKGFVWKRSARP